MQYKFFCSTLSACISVSSKALETVETNPANSYHVQGVNCWEYKLVTLIGQRSKLNTTLCSSIHRRKLYWELRRSHAFSNELFCWAENTSPCKITQWSRTSLEEILDMSYFRLLQTFYYIFPVLACITLCTLVLNINFTRVFQVLSLSTSSYMLCFINRGMASLYSFTVLQMMHHFASPLVTTQIA